VALRGKNVIGQSLNKMIDEERASSGSHVGIWVQPQCQQLTILSTCLVPYFEAPMNVLLVLANF